MSDDKPTIGFTVYEELGSPIYKLPEGVELPQPLTWESLEPFKVLDQDGLADGDRIIAPTLFGWAWANVSIDEHGARALSDNGKMGYAIEFAERSLGPPCWVSAGSYNVEGLKRLKITTETP